MRDIIYSVIAGDIGSVFSLLKEGRKKFEELFWTVKSLEDEELIKLGQILKSFPFGCDLNEILVDVVGKGQSLEEIKGGFRLIDRLGFPIHVCSYAVADIAEREGMTPFELMKMLREITDMPLDVDHFGIYGPMRYPKEIVNCSADCYRSGGSFNGCPRGRIHKRLEEKERAFAHERDKWFSLVQSVSVSLMSFQKKTSHAALPEETLAVIETAKKHGKGVGAIICVGNGKDELLKGLKACMEYEIDEIVIEGGPYNCGENRVRAFGEAVVLARIASKGKLVATNGQYENELRFGLKCGLNGVISGFPGNHHAYMSGYMPEDATSDKFGLPKVWEVMVEEVKDSYFDVPSGRETAEIIAKSAKFLGLENIYPNKKFSEIFVGDAHWLLLLSSPLGEKIKIKTTLNALIEKLKKEKVKKLGLIGSRFVSWIIAENMKDFVDEIYISDKNSNVEKITASILKNIGLNVKICNGDDFACINSSQKVVVASFVSGLIKKFKGKEKIITLED